MTCFGPPVFIYHSNNFNIITNLTISGTDYSVTNRHYVGSGRLRLRGSANVLVCYNPSCFSCKFGIGSIVYDRRSAIRGKLRKIFIKKVTTHMIERATAKEGSGRICIYFDSLNEVFDDDSLISAQEAINLARDFYEHQIELCT